MEFNNYDIELTDTGAIIIERDCRGNLIGEHVINLTPEEYADLVEGFATDDDRVEIFVVDFLSERV